MRARAWLDIFRERALSVWAGAIIARPRTVLLTCALVAVASAAFTALRLDFRSDRSALIDPALGWQQRYEAFKRSFPRWDDAVVVVDVRNAPSQSAADAFMTELAARLRDDRRFTSVLDGFPTVDAPPGLIYSLPTDDVRAIAADLTRATPAMAAPSLGALLRLAALGAPTLDERGRAELSGLLARIADAGRDDAPESARVLGAPPDVQRFSTPSGALALMMVSLREDAATDAVVGGNARSVRALRRHVERLQGEPGFGGVGAGVTGVPVLETDETLQSVRDASRASALGVLLIMALFVAVYRGVSVPALAGAALLLGLGCSFGWATLSVGHLQVLSVVFMVILVGLGADMAIHLISRLEVVHPDHDHMGSAIVLAFRGAGPGIVTGTLTTAAAFAATGLTDFAGVAELGIIAAGGIVLCTLAALAAFPASLMLLPRPERRLRGREGGVSRPYMRGALNFVDARAGFVVLVWGVVLLGAGYFATRVKYDTDLLALLPDNVDSVRWERRLSEDDERSVWHAVVVAQDAIEAESLVERLRALPVVADVAGASILFPADVEVKRAALRAVPPPPPFAPEGEPADVRHGAMSLASYLSGMGVSGGAEAAHRIVMFTDEQAAHAERRFLEDRDALRARVAALRAADPPRLDELPVPLRAQFEGVDGSLLLRVYPRADVGEGASVLSPGRLNPFVLAVLGAAPHATGPTVQIYESTRVIRRANVVAAGLAAMAILIILTIDFRNLGDVACALTPVLVAIVLLLGVMGAAGMRLNFANTIVAPLILGLGVTAGVHAVHRWRQQPRDKPAGLAGGAGRAITMTLATTTIGFACMMIAEHRGIRSLGMVMTMGLVMVWAATALLLPALLRLRTPSAYDHAGVASSAASPGTQETR